jgi:hypothetical protein
MVPLNDMGGSLSSVKRRRIVNGDRDDFLYVD